mgnify:CR=1 FL=1
MGADEVYMILRDYQNNLISAIGGDMLELSWSNEAPESVLEVQNG